MALLTRFDVHLVTGNRPNAGALVAVFVGLCGREFAVNNSDLDFTTGHDFTYVFGDQANVINPQDNDPRDPMPLDTDDLARFPIYIRCESPTGGAPGAGWDAWNLEEVQITLNPGPNELVLPTGLPGGVNLWLGTGIGKVLYLRT
jgi:hypothetical protein